jgi:hypothetical protein
VTGQHWGYCDPALHHGKTVPATWWAKGLEQVPFPPAGPDGRCWIRSTGSSSTWAACDEHLQLACRELLSRYSHVSVMEYP